MALELILAPLLIGVGAVVILVIFGVSKGWFGVFGGVKAVKPNEPSIDVKSEGSAIVKNSSPQPSETAVVEQEAHIKEASEPQTEPKKMAVESEATIPIEPTVITEKQPTQEARAREGQVKTRRRRRQRSKTGRRRKSASSAQRT